MKTVVIAIVLLLASCATTSEIQKPRRYCADNDTLDCTTAFAVNTLITTINTAIIIPIDTAWFLLVAWSCGERPTTYTTRTYPMTYHYIGGKEVHTMQTEITEHPGSPAQSIPDGIIVLIDPIGWWHTDAALRQDLRDGVLIIKDDMVVEAGKENE